MNGFRLTAAFVFAFAGMASGGEWLQWRGPGSNGVSDAKDLPASWSTDPLKNVAWVTPLEGPGGSTPIVTEKYIFLTSSVGPQMNLHASCYNRKDGTLIWSKKLADSGRKIARSCNQAAPSASCDGARVYFMFGQGTLVALSFDGSLLWKRELQEDHNTFIQNFGHSSSPLLHNGRLYIPLLRRIDVIPKGVTVAPGSLESCVLAIDAGTGKTLWAVERPTEAEAESRDAYITPAICTQGLVITGADLVTCHDLDTGKEVWRYDYSAEKRSKSWRMVPSPLVFKDLIISPYPRGKKMFALTDKGVPEWTYEGQVPDVCTPVLLDGKLYILDDIKRCLNCLDARTGKQLWQTDFVATKGFFSSPLAADGKVYMISLAGEAFVCSAEDGKLLEQFSVNEADCWASPVAVDNELFIRTPTRLICVKKTN